MGVECEEEQLHLCPDVGVWEVIDQDGAPIPAGQLGEFVCTGLLNDAMPLIRYRTGDMVVLTEEPCRCGRPFPILERVEGRCDDMIVLPNGRRIGRMDPAFKAEFPIREAQIVQTETDKLVVRIVPTDRYREYDGENIKHAILSRLEYEIDVEIAPVPSIPRTSSGKFQAVISQIHTKLS